LPLH
jgi:bifunctional DNase/RNase